MLNFFKSDLDEEKVIRVISDHLEHRGFRVLSEPIEVSESLGAVDIVAVRGEDHILIEIKAPKNGYVTLDNIAQVNSAAKAYTGKIRPIVIGKIIAAGSTKSVAAHNDIRLIDLTAANSLDDIGKAVDSAIDESVEDHA